MMNQNLDQIQFLLSPSIMWGHNSFNNTWKTSDHASPLNAPITLSTYKRKTLRIFKMSEQILLAKSNRNVAHHMIQSVLICYFFANLKLVFNYQPMLKSVSKDFLQPPSF